MIALEVPAWHGYRPFADYVGAYLNYLLKGGITELAKLPVKCDLF